MLIRIILLLASFALLCVSCAGGAAERNSLEVRTSGDARVHGTYKTGR